MAVQFPFSPFDNTPAGELEHHQLLLLRRGEISSPPRLLPTPAPVCWHFTQGNLNITTYFLRTGGWHGRLAVCSVLSKLQWKNMIFCWWSGIVQELPKRFLLLLLGYSFPEPGARGNSLFWNYFVCAYSWFQAGGLSELPVWDIQEAIWNPGAEPPRPSSRRDVPKQSFFPHFNLSTFVCFVMSTDF